MALLPADARHRLEQLVVEPHLDDVSENARLDRMPDEACRDRVDPTGQVDGAPLSNAPLQRTELAGLELARVTLAQCLEDGLRLELAVLVSNEQWLDVVRPYVDERVRPRAPRRRGRA